VYIFLYLNGIDYIYTYMPSYLNMLPEDILTYIYKILYKSIVNDMKNDNNYKNLKTLNKLLEITKNPYIDNLNYSDFLVSSCIDKIVEKYTSYKINYDDNNIYNSLLYNISLYYKSYYIKSLDVDINKIEIYNFFIYNLYKDNDNELERFNNTYFATSYFTGTTKNINKNGFILEKEGSFRCLAELFYYIIDFHDFIKQIIYMNIEIIEHIGNVLKLSEAKIKERDNLIDILNYHNNHRYLEGLFYDIEYKCAKPQLGNEI